MEICVFDDLEPVKAFRKIDSPMSIREGIKILAGRLGLSGGRIRALARDRYPSEAPKEERRSVYDFKVKCFVRSDIIFTDILHAGYEELKHIGIGRRYLINKILRAVVAGTCDSIDATGTSGDFPPRSWLGQEKAEYVKSVQERGIRAVKEDDSKLLKSIKVRLRGVSTHILLSLSGRSDAIRTTARKYIVGRLGSGLRGLSDMLISFRKKFVYRTRTDDCKNRKKRSKRKYKVRSLAHKGFSVLKRSVFDLRKLIDPSVPSWYRRPTDEDWTEGSMTGDTNTRKPFTYKRRGLFKKYGMGCVPGITDKIDAEEWTSVKTDWSMDEVRSKFENQTYEEGKCQDG